MTKNLQVLVCCGNANRLHNYQGVDMALSVYNTYQPKCDSHHSERIRNRSVPVKLNYKCWAL